MRVLAVVVMIGLAASRASAEPARLPPLLSWRAPADCPAETEIRARIAERARRTRADGAEPYAIVVVTADDQGLVARLQIKSGRAVDTREVRGATCEKVADAVAWVLALAWAPPPPPPPPHSPPEPALRAVVPLPRATRFHAHAAARLSFDIGTLPGAAAGAGIALGVDYQRTVTLELTGTRLASRFKPLMPDRPAGVEVGLSALGARICSGRVLACVGMELGRLDGKGVALADDRAASLRWLAVTAGLRWRGALTADIALVAQADAVAPLARPQFTLDDGTVVFRSAAAAARIGLAIELVPSW